MTKERIEDANIAKAYKTYIVMVISVWRISQYSSSCSLVPHLSWSRGAATRNLTP